jgi:sugar diacid utilization regulator
MTANGPAEILVRGLFVVQAEVATAMVISSSRETEAFAHDASPTAGWALVSRLREVHHAMTDAVIRGDGLPRVAELAAAGAGGAVAIAVPALGTAIAPCQEEEPGEHRALTRWVTERGLGRPAMVPPNLLTEVPIRLGEEIVGVVALLRTGGPPRAEATEFLHLAATATMTKLAIEEAKDAVEENLRASFIEWLRSGEDLDRAEIVRRAARLGCDLSRGAVVVGVELARDRPQLVLATIAEEHPGALAQPLDPTDDGLARIYALLPATGAAGAAAATLASARRLATRLARLGTVGLSSFYSDPAELGGAAQEAELVLDVLRNSKTHGAEEICSGTYKLLFRVLASHPEEMRAFYESTIAPLVRYDDQYGTELVRTLQAYFEENCHMSATAAAVFAHRHTIAYRLERIRDLTGLDPMLCEDRERLGLSLKVHRLIAPQLPR